MINNIEETRDSIFPPHFGPYSSLKVPAESPYIFPPPSIRTCLPPLVS